MLFRLLHRIVECLLHFERRLVEPDIDHVGFVGISVKVMEVEGEKLWDGCRRARPGWALGRPATACGRLLRAGRRSGNSPRGGPRPS